MSKKQKLESKKGGGPINTANTASMSKMRRENILNEYKGSIFEYLVAVGLARRCGLEKSFLAMLATEYREMLIRYESYLRNNDLALLQALPALANNTLEALYPRIAIENVEQIFLIGKNFSRTPSSLLSLSSSSSSAASALSTPLLVPEASSLPLSLPMFHEADLLLKLRAKEGDEILTASSSVSTGSSGKTSVEYFRNSLGISLKLCKDKAFVNTKNAGAQSFIVKYFAYAESFTEQERLNKCLQKSFELMGRKLYQIAGLRTEFKTEFDDFWSAANYSHLPGEVSLEMQREIHKHYFRVISEVYRILKNMIDIDRRAFIMSLYALCGLSSADILQVICFHAGHCVKSDHIFRRVKIISFSDLEKEAEQVEILPLKKGLSSFEIKLSFLILQIRVKPMNCFTVPGVKINCSVKHIS